MTRHKLLPTPLARVSSLASPNLPSTVIGSKELSVTSELVDKYSLVISRSYVKKRQFKDLKCNPNILH